MLRIPMTAPMALMMLVPALAIAAGRPAETCLNAGYRAGTAAFDMCVSRVDGDDPLAALDGGELGGRADKGAAKSGDQADTLGAVVPARTAVPSAAGVPTPPREELPMSFNTPVTLASPPPSIGPTVPSGPAWVWPTPPTAPTLPSVLAPSVPGWNFSSQ